MSEHALNSQTTLDYHERTKHHFHRFARSAGYMDWDNQPDPFRTYEGSRTIPLPLNEPDPPFQYSALYRPDPLPPVTFSLKSVGKLYELSLGLSAWKAISGQRWALRMNPSSGNLHPTEGHLIALGVNDLPDGLYHYNPLQHAFEERAVISREMSARLMAILPTPALLVTLTSIFWRESWKYGERAFRYCQHDVGHALAALSLSARLLGWRLIKLDAPDEDIAKAFGFDRVDWPDHEAEEPDLIAAIVPSTAASIPPAFPAEAADILKIVTLTGRPNRLSRRHREWAVIPQVARSCRQPHNSTATAQVNDSLPVCQPPPEVPLASAIIRQRRSAQAFDPRRELDRKSFFGLLDRTIPRAGNPPFESMTDPTRISLVLFVHRIQGVPPGLYMFIRHPAHLEALQAMTYKRFVWEPAHPELPLYLLEQGDYRAEAIDLSCRQEIGGFSTFSLGMLARFTPEVSDTPWVYRHLFWEAGMVGQVLYLESEAWGVRGTGIGCYFDDPVHDRLGMQGRGWQSLYHFTIGFPIEDTRLQTLPPYFHLAPDRTS